VADIDLDGEVGRRVRAQIEPAAPGHAVGVGDPETLVRLDAPLAQAPPQRRRATVPDRQPQFLRQDEDEQTQQAPFVVVFEGRRHDLQIPPVIGETNAGLLGEDVQQP